MYRADPALCWQPPQDCDLTPEQVEVVRRTAKMLWRSKPAKADGGANAELRSALLKECDRGFVRELKAWFRSEFQASLTALRESLKPSSDVVEQIRRRLVESVGRTKLYRLEHAFSTMQEGKTKVWPRLYTAVRASGLTAFGFKGCPPLKSSPAV